MSIVPYQRSEAPTFIQKVGPLAVLARENPELAYDILSRKTAIQEREQEARRALEQIAAVRDISSDHCSCLREWLRNRAPYESGAEVEFEGEAGERSFFGRRNCVRAKTTFRTF